MPNNNVLNLGALTPALGFSFLRRPTGYIRVTVSQRERGFCGAVVLSIVIKLTVSGAPERFPKSQFFARMGGLARD
jgi:hypothetical protein